MTFPTAIAFTGVKSSPDLCADVVARVQQLERYLGDILACRVDIDATSRSPGRDNRFGVHIRLALPCVEIEAGGKPDVHASANDAHRLVADTFDVLTRRIEEYVHRRCTACSRYVGMPRDS